MSYRLYATSLIWMLTTCCSLVCPWPVSAQTTSTIKFVLSSYSVPQSPQTIVAVTFSKVQTSGNLNVVIVGWNDSTASVTSVTDSKGNSYSLAVGPTVRAGQVSQSIYFASN